MRGALLLGLLASCGDNAARPVDAGPADAGVENDLFWAPAFYAVSSSSAAATGDVDGDGKLDVVVASTGSPGAATILQNVGEGRLAPIMVSSMGGYSDAIASGDLNGDGRADFAVTDSMGSIDVSLGAGTTMHLTVGPWPIGVAFGDLIA